MKEQKIARYAAFFFCYLGFLAVFFALGRLDTAFSFRFPYLSLGALFLFSAGMMLFLYREERAGATPHRSMFPHSYRLMLGSSLIFATVFLLASKKEAAADAAFLLLSAACEECYFRGLGARFFLENTREVSAALMLSLLFGCAHFSRIFLGEPIAFVCLRAVYATLIGVLFFIVYRKTGGILVPILLHSLHNLIFL